MRASAQRVQEPAAHVAHRRRKQLAAGLYSAFDYAAADAYNSCVSVWNSKWVAGSSSGSSSQLTDSSYRMDSIVSPCLTAIISEKPDLFVERDDAGIGAEGDGLRVFDPGDLRAFTVNIGHVVDHMDRSDDSTDVEHGRICADFGDVQGDAATIAESRVERVEKKAETPGPARETKAAPPHAVKNAIADSTGQAFRYWPKLG